MANCKDCLHVKCCEREAYDSGGALDYSYAEKCDLFKDRSRLEEVVRCKDCEFGEPSYSVSGWIYCNDTGAHNEPYHYCAAGVRREGV